MPEPKPISERTRLEIERGRVIAGRAKRHSDLDRYVAGKKISVMVALPGHALYEPKGRVNLFYLYGKTKDVALIAHQNIIDDDYPSEAVMSAIALVVGATLGTEGIPDAQTIDPITRARRNEYRDKHLGHWRDK